MSSKRQQPSVQAPSGSTEQELPSGILEPSRSPHDSSFEELLRAAAHLSEPDTSRGARLAVGSTLAAGRFQILRRLGRGGMGLVVEAFDAERRTKVALKVLTGLRADRVYRLKTEFRALLDVRHDNLLRLHELFADDGLWYYTMELVDGAPFDRFVRAEASSRIPRLRASLAQLCGAVLAIHEAGKLHRDLKPSNVLVTELGKVVVLDFGLSIDAHSGGVGQTVSERAICGTPAYMAPEQAAGRAALPASDVYAVGVMLFEALTGRLPFPGSAGEMIAAKQRDVAPELTPSREVPADLCELCSRLLAREPSDRPSSVELERRLRPQGDMRRKSGERGAEKRLLFGRKHELALLQRAFADTCSGQSVVVSLSGESGLGKSSLCAEFLERAAQESDAVVLSGRCYERESVPFKAFDPLVDALSRRMRKLSSVQMSALLPSDAAALTRLFPVLERVPAFAQAVPQADCSPLMLQQRAFAAFGALLAKLRAGGPLVLAMDDVQWADADSFTFLQHLLSALTAPLLLIVSHRSSSQGDALSRLLALARENRKLSVRCLELTPLASTATGQLLCALAPELERDQPLLDSLVQSSEGNPFFAATLARFARERGATHTSLAAALHARIGESSAGAARLLSLLALAGEPLLARVALEAADANHEDLEQLLRQNLASLGTSAHSHGSGKTVECYHDRIRESVVGSLDERSRAGYARRLSAALATLDEVSAELQRRCLVHAGDHTGALRLAMVVAERAAAALAFDRAAELYKEALASPQLAQDERLTLIEKCATALVAAGRGGEAGPLYREAASLTSGESSLSFLRLAANQLLITGHYVEGRPLLERVCDRAGVFVPRDTVRSMAHLAWTETRLRASGLRFVASDQERGQLALSAAYTLCASLLNYGPLHAAPACSNYLRLAIEYGNVQHFGFALGFNAILHSRFASRGRWTRTLVARLVECTESTGIAPFMGFASFVQGAVAQNTLDFVQARVHLNKAHALYSAAPDVHEPLDTCRLYMQNNDHALGDFAALARDTPPAIDAAFRRGRVWLGVMMTGPSSLPAWLLHDDLDAASNRVEDARRRWIRPARPQLPDFMLLAAEALLSRYRGQPERGLDMLLTQMPSFAATMGHMYRFMVKPAAAVWQGMCAASTLRAGGRRHARRDELRHHLVQSIAALERGSDPRFGGAAASFRAVLALDDGEVERAATLLRGAIERTTAAPRMVGIAQRLRLGQLLGGDAGAHMVAESRAQMVEQGAVNCEALAEHIFPGLRPI